jgi:hypothetical protein
MRIVEIKKTKVKVLFLVLVGILFLNYGNKRSHPTINEIIVKGFVAKNNKEEFSMKKFKKYHFDLSKAMLIGDFITKSGYFNPSNSEVSAIGDRSLFEHNTIYTEEKKKVSALDWIKHGGYSADVPEIPASLRHFYDPSKPEGERYLTDKINSKAFDFAQSFLSNPKTNGVDWALGTAGNFGVLEHVYTWEHGKAYLRGALEETDVKKRKSYMAKAWRSLGETLHMIADNGCPAHVRNDGHPALPIPLLSYFGNPDPYEEQIEVSNVAVFDGGPVPKNLANTFKEAKTARKIAHELAIFTNENFFSNETISGTDWKGNEIKPVTNPNNIHQSPKINAAQYDGTYYTAQLDDGIEYKLCTDLQYFMGISAYKTYPYIDEACVKSQARVLIPAIKEAGINVMKLYIPELNIKITELDVSGNISGTIQHKTDKEYPNTISYSGPVHIKDRYTKVQGTIMAASGRFTGKIKSPETEVFAEIEFGGITVFSDRVTPKSEVAAVVLRNKHSGKKGHISNSGFNNPLKIISQVRDFDIEVNKDGSFQKGLQGQSFKVYLDDKKSLDDGYILKAGAINLTGEIDMALMFNKIKSGTSTLGDDGKDLKIGAMKYTSSGSFTEKETINASSWGAEDYAAILQDYTFTTQAVYDIMLRGSGGPKESYSIYASTENGKYTIKNNPSAKQQKRSSGNISYSHTLYLEIAF